MSLWHRLDWFNIAGLAVPWVLAVLIDRRTRRRRELVRDDQR
jgi:hypothetical protein